MPAGFSASLSYDASNVFLNISTSVGQQQQGLNQNQQGVVNAITSFFNNGGSLPPGFTVEVSFRKPILLPATVQFGERSNARDIRFGVRGAGKGTPHLGGEISFT